MVTFMYTFYYAFFGANEYIYIYIVNLSPTLKRTVNIWIDRSIDRHDR